MDLVWLSAGAALVAASVVDVALGDSPGSPGAPGAPRAAAPAAPAPQPLAAAKLASALPSEWRPLDAAAAAMRASLDQVGVSGAAVAAWGDPARRCYAVWLGAEVKGKPSVVVAGLRAALQPDAAPAPAAPAPPSAGPGELRLEVRAPLTGAAVVRWSADGPLVRLGSLVCGHVERYPESCRARCAALFAALEAP